MIGLCREEHRHDLDAIATDVRSWLRDEDTPAADAGGRFVAALLETWRRSMAKES